MRDPASGEVLDEALALWFPAPASETGEDVAELQLHGSRAVIAGVLKALGRIEGLRPAEAGEFTRRAFENGRLDLTAVEGLADLIYAGDRSAAAAGVPTPQGVSGRARGSMAQAARSRRSRWSKRGIDFSDEADVPDDLLGPALAIARELRGDMAGALAGAGRGERLREGLVVAIAGPPNAGKSTLLNRIAAREVAIVSPHAGTTRDVIEVHLDLDGYPVTLLDTAGIRETDNPIEQEGVRRARARAAAADLVLWVSEVGADPGVNDPAADLIRSMDRLWCNGRSSFAPSAFGRPADRATSPAVWLVRNKIDLAPSNEREFTFRTFLISATMGTGVGELLDAIARYARDYFNAGEPALIARERHRRALEDAVAALDRAMVEGGGAGREDLVAEELRLAARALGRLTGRVDVEEILDVIFRDFCIGK